MDLNVNHCGYGDRASEVMFIEKWSDCFKEQRMEKTTLWQREKSKGLLRFGEGQERSGEGSMPIPAGNGGSICFAIKWASLLS